MAIIVQLPPNVSRFHAGWHAVRTRAQAVGASPDARRRALQTLLVEMRAGRSSGAAVALANGVLRDHPAVGRGGDAA